MSIDILNNMSIILLTNQGDTMKINYYNHKQKRTSTTFNEVEIQTIQIWMVNSNLDLMAFDKVIADNLHLHAKKGAIFPKIAFLLKILKTFEV